MLCSEPSDHSYFVFLFLFLSPFLHPSDCLFWIACLPVSIHYNVFFTAHISLFHPPTHKKAPHSLGKGTVPSDLSLMGCLHNGIWSRSRERRKSGPRTKTVTWEHLHYTSVQCLQPRQGRIGKRAGYENCVSRPTGCEWPHSPLRHSTCTSEMPQQEGYVCGVGNWGRGIQTSSSRMSQARRMRDTSTRWVSDFNFLERRLHSLTHELSKPAASSLLLGEISAVFSNCSVL